MSTPAADCIDAIQNLGEGASLVIHDVAWDDYERVVTGLEDSRRFRVTYDQGTLEVVSPRSDHERYARIIDALLRVLSDELDLTIEAYGATTWKSRKLRKGAEADNCFYIANSRRIIGKELIDLATDPPPDIVVEIDVTARSWRKFQIYAAFMVPEIWRYDRKEIRFFGLSDCEYVEIPESRSISKLKPGMLTDALDMSKREGQTAAVRAFRRKVRSPLDS